MRKLEPLTIIKECIKCKNKFNVTGLKSYLESKKVKKYCSYKCSNSHKHTDETKEKISNGVNNSEIFSTNNKEGNKKRLEKYKHIPRDENSRLLYSFTCLSCGKTELQYQRNKRYHKECWLKISGGIKPGTSRGKKGIYKGFKCDSSYELAFVIYCLEHNIKLERNTQGFDYKFENKDRKFYPDFIINGNEYVEIKNYHSEITDAKISNFPHQIKIYYTETMDLFLNYAKQKYGKDFIKLYN